MSSDPSGDDEDAALRARLDKLTSDLRGRAPPPLQQSPQAPRPAPASAMSGMSLGLQAGSEFVSAVVVGAGIGWVLDKGLGTKPAFLIVFFLIGVAAGVWNVIRLTSPQGATSAAISPLSQAEAPDKDGRRSVPGAGRDVSHARPEASGGSAQGPPANDDDED
jgi:ATP synthase protein I